jgi:acyl carrier protein
LLWWFQDRLSHASGVAATQITLSSSFTEDLGVDSLDIVELVMELEEEFGVTIPDDEAEQIKTVADAIGYLEQHRRGNGKGDIVN